MQSCAQETIKIRENRRKEIFKTSPSNYFCTFLAQVNLSAPASLTGVLDGLLHGLEHSAPVKPIPRLPHGSTRPVQGGSLNPSARLQRRSPPWPHQGQSWCYGLRWGYTWAVPTVVAGAIGSRDVRQPASQQLCLTKLLFEHAFSFTQWVRKCRIFSQTLYQPIQLHPNYLCGNRMLCQECYSVYLSILPNRRHLYNQEIQYFLQQMKATVQESDWSCKTLLFHRHWK